MEEKAGKPAGAAVQTPCANVDTWGGAKPGLFEPGSAGAQIRPAAPRNATTPCAAHRPGPATDAAIRRRHLEAARALHDGTRARPSGAQDWTERVSPPEVAQLVSVSLEAALGAIIEPDPAGALQLQACEGRKAMRQALSSLPPAQAGHPSVQIEYRKAIVFQNVALDLAFQIMSAIDRYAKATGDDREDEVR